MRDDRDGSNTVSEPRADEARSPLFSADSVRTGANAVGQRGGDVVVSLQAGLLDSQTAFTVCDAAGRIVWINSAWQRQMGFRLDEVRGHAALACAFGVAGAERIREALQDADGASRGISLRGSDGVENEVLLATVRLASGETLCIWKPRAHLGDGAHRPADAECLTEPARLTGVVTHEFNNVLTAILGQVELAISTLDGRSLQLSSTIDALYQVVRSVYRAARLTRQMLSLSRPSDPEFDTLDLTAMLADSQRMVQILAGENVRVSLATSAAPLHALTDRAAIERILAILASSARDAKLHGGDLELRAGRVSSDDGSRERVRLEVVCAGPAEFWSDAALSEVRTLAERAGGAVSVERRPDGEATIAIVLPSADPPRASRSATPISAIQQALTPRGVGCVLLCEDDDRVRETFTYVLEQAGYAVLAARCASDAVAAAANSAMELELLITDVGLPGVDGASLAASMRRTHPNLRVLLISGYHEQIERGSDDPSVAFLAKPFTPRELLMQISRLMQTRAVDSAAR